MSAGLAVQGGWIFTALHGSITSDKALANPYNRDVTMGGALFELPYMDNVLTGTHFGLRDRMGRLLTFHARLEQDHVAVAPFAVAVDEDSSIGIDAQTGAAQVFGVGDGVWLASTAGHHPPRGAQNAPHRWSGDHPAPVHRRHLRPLPVGQSGWRHRHGLGDGRGPLGDCAGDALRSLRFAGPEVLFSADVRRLTGSPPGRSLAIQD